MNLCCLLQVSLGFGTKFTWIVIIKIFAINLPSQPFLGCHLWFHIYLSWGCILFSQLGCFGIDITSFCNFVYSKASLWPALEFVKGGKDQVLNSVDILYDFFLLYENYCACPLCYTGWFTTWLACSRNLYKVTWALSDFSWTLYRWLDLGDLFVAEGWTFHRVLLFVVEFSTCWLVCSRTLYRVTYRQLV